MSEHACKACANEKKASNFSEWKGPLRVSLKFFGEWCTCGPQWWIKKVWGFMLPCILGEKARHNSSMGILFLFNFKCVPSGWCFVANCTLVHYEIKFSLPKISHPEASCVGKKWITRRRKWKKEKKIPNKQTNCGPFGKAVHLLASTHPNHLISPTLIPPLNSNRYPEQVYPNR